MNSKNAIPFVVTAALVLGGCAGGAGGQSADAAGFDLNASQEEVDAAIADLDPVEIVYQPGAVSPESAWAVPAHEFKEAVEDRSGGKITVDLIWGQAIAGFGEVDDALVDGRIDIADTVPLYDPSKYPAADALATVLPGLPTEPVMGEAVYQGVVSELAANTSELTSEIEGQDLYPIVPVMSSGAYHLACNSEITTPEDWEGRQIRVAHAAHGHTVEDIGATPLSMEYTETYESLQRNAIDCAMTQMMAGADSGIFEAASYLHVIEGESSITRGGLSVVGGSGFMQLPTPYQQIIFDSSPIILSGMSAAIASGSVDAGEQIAEANGEVLTIDEDTAQAIGQSQRAHQTEVLESGALEGDKAAEIEAAVTKWSKLAEEEGVTNDVSLVDVEQVEQEQTDPEYYMDYSQRMLEEVLVSNRPSS